MPQLLLELFSEEIPARMQAAAARDLERLFGERLKAADLTLQSLRAYSGPRRLTLVAEGLPVAQADRDEEFKGPRVGSPDQAIEGFLRKTGVTRAELEERDGLYFASVARKGRPTPQIVAEAVEAVVRDFPWPKSMTWGTGRLRWVRPLKRILCLFDGAVVPLDIDGLKSGDLTEGHRFMGSGQALPVGDFASYAKALSDNFVVLDAAERKQAILSRATALCAAKGLELVDDPGLLDEVAGLSEWPTPVLGDMDPAFLDLPAEVIRTSMRTHQKYFAVRDPRTGGLAPHFVTVANIEASDGGVAIAKGNARVLSARLNDARFFWDEDRKIPLENRIEKLKGVIFHARLGTLYDRVERVKRFSRTIARCLHCSPDISETAAKLAKADLTTGMVGEFPELQGIMGRYYALAEARGETPWSQFEELRRTTLVGQQSVDDEDQADPWFASLSNLERFAVADAIREHYRPQGPADEVPTDSIAVAVALADKLDMLMAFTAIGERASGSRDPYALRRAGLGIIRILLASSRRVSLRDVTAVYPVANMVFYRNVWEQSQSVPYDETKLVGQVYAFLTERLKVLLKDKGHRYDVIDAVLSIQDDDLVRVVARIEAAETFLSQVEGVDLIAGYKRAVNILRNETKKDTLYDSYFGPYDPNIDAPPAEERLRVALSQVSVEIEPRLDSQDYAGAMGVLATLRVPIYEFFNQVMVNDTDEKVRLNRLRLLNQIREVANRVADFSLISG